MLPLLLMLAAGPPPPAAASPQAGLAAAAADVRPALTLKDALARARARSPLRRGAEQRLQGAASGLRQIHRTPNPFVEFRTENWGGDAAAGPRDTFAVVTQTFELGGKYASRRREALAYEDLARAEVAAVDWDLAGEVAERYVSALQARATRSVLVEHQTSLAELVRMLAARVGEGTTPEADWRRLEAEQTRAQFAVTRAEIVLQHELALLSSLIGEQVDAGRLVTPTVSASLARRTPDVAAIEARPDIRAARADANRLDAVASLERSAGVPDLLVSAGYKGTGGIRTGVAAIAFDVPLFNRNGAAFARAAGEASAAQQGADYATEQARARADAEWIAAQRLTEEAARLDTALLTPADVVRTAARSAFLEGDADILRLVDAERAYADAARDAAELQLEALRALIRARLALGEEPLP